MRRDPWYWLDRLAFALFELCMAGLGIALFAWVLLQLGGAP